MGAWADLETAIGAVITGAGYTLAMSLDPAGWPSWAVGASGAPEWVSMELTPGAAPIDGSGGSVVRHALTLRLIGAHPWNRGASQRAVLDAERTLRAALETSAGIAASSAQVMYETCETSPLGLGIAAEIRYTVLQGETY